MEFYDKISPTFAPPASAGAEALRAGGKKYQIPIPTICPDCRMIQLMAWRNERGLHKSNCLLCDKKIVSIYAKEKNFKVLCNECFWSDKWDALKQGREFDFSKSFFDQFSNLLKETKLLNLFSVNNENSEYVNQETNSSNCYLCIGGISNTDCCYCTYALSSKNCIDCLGITYGENLYNCTFCTSCYSSQSLFNCHTCRNCYFCEDCIGCNDCFGSINLRHKKYHFFNKQLTKPEYQEKVEKYLNSHEGIQKAQKEFSKHKINYIYRYANTILCDNDCSGDNLVECKNAQNCYYSLGAEDAMNSFLLNRIKDVRDGLAVGRGELVYLSGSSPGLFATAFLTSCFNVKNSYYCYMCHNSDNLFGCVGLNHKQYCIFNKEYTKEEYEKNVSKIIEHMIRTGEWGNFFPLSISPFGYNETMAMDYYSKNKKEILEIDGNWFDDDERKYDGSLYIPEDIRKYNFNSNPNAEKEINDCLEGIIKCNTTGKFFRIVSRELAQYIEKNIQIPHDCPDTRHRNRLKLINKMELYHRQCMCEETGHNHDGKCKNEFETTYAPDRSERVYCEDCYQKSIM